MIARWRVGVRPDASVLLARQFRDLVDDDGSLFCTPAGVFALVAVSIGTLARVGVSL